MPNMLDTKAVADLISVTQETVRGYHKKGRMPKADAYFGRSPAWKQETIEDWMSTRKKGRKTPATG